MKHKCKTVNGKFGRIYRHVAEQALGKSLPESADVHHHSDTQLVICENREYHALLHVRTKALRACGHADWRRCPYCKEYDDIKNMKHHSEIERFYHLKCFNLYRRQRYAAKRV